MAETDLVPKLDIRLYDYFQEEKIEQLYNQIVKRSEVSSTHSLSKEKGKGLKAEGGLGDLLASLGLKAGISAEAQAKNTTSESTEYKLSPEQKLGIIWEYLRAQGMAANLNHCLRQNPNKLTVFTLFLVHGKGARFTWEDPDKNNNDTGALVRIQCRVEDYRAEFYCSRGYFGSSALVLDIEAKITRDISGIVSVKSVDHEKKRIFLNPIAF